MSSPAHSFITLIGWREDDLLTLPHGHRDNHDTISRWLAGNEARRNKVAAVVTREDHHQSVDALQHALADGDKRKVEEAVEEAIIRGKNKWKKERVELQNHLSKENTSEASGKSHKAGGAFLSEARKASIASCVFDVTQATSQVAALAANINDAVRTCRHVGYVNGTPVAGGLGNRFCAINIQNIFYYVAAISSTLSVAANNCACSFERGLSALCSASISTMIQSIIQLGISAQLIAGACAYHRLPVPVYAPISAGPQEEMNYSTTPMISSGRRLLVGGGVGSDLTQCAVDLTQAVTYLAEAGLAINAAANPKAGKSCPPAKTGKKGEDRLLQAFCAVDVTGALYGFLQAVYFIFTSISHCTAGLNLVALCGAGISGVLSSLTGVAYSGSGMWLTCTELTGGWPKPSPPPLVQKLIEANVIGNSGHGGRRLSEEEDILPLVDKFSDPVEAFKSIGYDITDPDAEFRKAIARSPLPEDIVELVEERPSEAVDRAPRQCK